MVVTVPTQKWQGGQYHPTMARECKRYLLRHFFTQEIAPEQARESKEASADGEVGAEAEGGQQPWAAVGCSRVRSSQLSDRVLHHSTERPQLM